MVSCGCPHGQNHSESRLVAHHFSVGLFCFFQRKAEWVGLSEKHPELFEQAVAYEDKVKYEATAMEGRQYTWSGTESLRELVGRRDEIMAMNLSVLARLDPSQIAYDPYPYLHVENALDPALYAELADSFPSVHRIAGGLEPLRDPTLRYGLAELRHQHVHLII